MFFFVKYCSIYKKWDDTSVSKWEHKKQQGIIRFVLCEGVLKWGILSGLIFCSMFFLGRELEVQRVIITCLIWLVTSVMFGFSLWYATSTSYKERHNNKDALNK